MLQYKCLETRLQLAEERLNQDRQQRIDRMSKTEADLLVENTSLKVTCDELQRQMEREREKVNTLEVRLGKMQMQPAAGDSAHGHLNGDSLSQSPSHQVTRDNVNNYMEKLHEYRDIVDDLAKSRIDAEKSMRKLV